MGTPTVGVDPRSAIAEANARFMDAFRRGDAAAVAGLYGARAQLLPAHSDVVEGEAAIQQFWRGAMDMGLNEAMLETRELEVRGDTAYEVGRYRLGAGGQVADTGKYVVIWRNEGGAWRLHRDIWTTSRPAASSQ